MNCRGCQSTKLEELFSLGIQYVVGFPQPGKAYDGLRAPLDMVMCEDCTLIQLAYTVPRDEMYKEYWYRSGMNQTMRDILFGVTQEAQEFVDLFSGDTVIDIGSNDGTLLGYYPDDVIKIGFEPSQLGFEQQKVKGLFRIYQDYFRATAENKAKIITSCAVFYDLDDPNKFLENIVSSLAPDGVWVDQQNYLGSMQKNLTYDNISHEHVCYYSFVTFKSLVERNGLKVISVSLNDTNSGSFRSFVVHANSDKLPDGTVDLLLRSEINQLLDVPQTWKAFYTQIDKAGRDLFNFVDGEVSLGKEVYIYGASTRGQVILQFCGLDNDLIKGAAERNPAKVGLVTPGTNIPIYDEEYVRGEKPAYMLVLPYFYRKEFIEREEKYIRDGGSLVFPLPKFEVVNESSIR